MEFISIIGCKQTRLPRCEHLFVIAHNTRSVLVLALGGMSVFRSAFADRTVQPTRNTTCNVVERLAILCEPLVRTLHHTGECFAWRFHLSLQTTRAERSRSTTDRSPSQRARSERQQPVAT